MSRDSQTDSARHGSATEADQLRKSDPDVKNVDQSPRSITDDPFRPR